MLDYLTFVSLRSHFVKTNLISLTLFQFADFVCKLRERFPVPDGLFVIQRIVITLFFVDTADGFYGLPDEKSRENKSEARDHREEIGNRKSHSPKHGRNAVEKPH